MHTLETWCSRAAPNKWYADELFVPVYQTDIGDVYRLHDVRMKHKRQRPEQRPHGLAVVVLANK